MSRCFVFYPNELRSKCSIWYKSWCELCKCYGFKNKYKCYYKLSCGHCSENRANKRFIISTELLYTTQGASYETALADYKNELGYIVIPAMLQIHLSKSITLDMGPQVGFLLNEKNNFDVQKSNTFDASANAGLGLKITNSIFAQARYCVGLTELKPNSEIKNNVVQLSLGILF